jgi:hypothetical protein
MHSCIAPNQPHSPCLATPAYPHHQPPPTPAPLPPQVAKFSNTELCSLTEQVIFSEPYAEAANNHWTSPQLDAQVVALRSDVEAKKAASALKRKFMTHAEALLHGDLHTGEGPSMMQACSAWCISWCTMPAFCSVLVRALDPFFM